LQCRHCDLKARGCQDILIAVTDGRKGLAAALKPIYQAASAEAALAELDTFEQSDWGKKFPTVAATRRHVWDIVISFFAFPREVRRVIYTTNSIESVNAQLR